jgi:hypothetical protein
MKTNTHFFILPRSFLLTTRNISDKISREIQNMHFIFSNVSFFRKSYRLRDNVEKYCRTGQVTDVNMEHANSLLDT